jgi:hypothetical protein
METDHELGHISWDIAVASGASHIRCDGLLDQPDLSLGGQLERPQVTPVDSILGEPAGSNGKSQGVSSVMCGTTSSRDDLGSF